MFLFGCNEKHWKSPQAKPEVLRLCELSVLPVHGHQQQPALALREEAGKSTLHNTRQLPTSVQTEDDRMQALAHPLQDVHPLEISAVVFLFKQLMAGQ